MSTLILTLAEELQKKITTLGKGVAREVTLPNISNKIMVAIGMRRTGKSYFLLQAIKQLHRQEKITLSRILYLNFEDDRLFPLTTQKFSDLLDSFYSTHPENHDQLCYLFLDEIQNVDNWQQVIRRYFDTKKVKIYLTGSSAKLLSKEIATSLRGRSIATEIWPFSFTEFLKAKKISLPKTYGQRSLDILTTHLKIYIKQGGFPEINCFPSDSEITQEDRQRILQDYLSVVIFHDIVERHNITNISLVRYMLNFLLKQVGHSFSIHKFHNDLKSQGFAVSKTTVHDYLSYIEDAYLAFAVPLYSESLRKVQSNPRKIYAIDTGLINACTFGFAENIGHYFENLIYLDLRRARHEIYYYLTATRKEIDFLTRDPQGKWHLFQVCWNVEKHETLEREVTALEEAEKELHIKGECITPTTYFTFFLPTIQNHKTL